MDYIYIDNSNLFIEGQRVSAVKQDLATDIYEAQEKNILDQNYHIDFGKLYRFLCGGDKLTIKKAILFGSRPPPNDGLWACAESAGFKVIIMDRNHANKEKKIDTSITTLMVEDAFNGAEKGKDTFTLVAGDSDYVPPIESVKRANIRTEIVFWSHAARELQDVADKFIPLDAYLKIIKM